jgi:rubrerythrin
MPSIWVCPQCDAVHYLNDFDEDWLVHGCPACHEETRNPKNKGCE